MCQTSVSSSNGELELMIDFCFVGAHFQFQARGHVGASNSYVFLIVHNPLIFFKLRIGKC